MNPEHIVIHLEFDSLASFIYNGLISYGYVPNNDEVLDVADIALGFIVQLMENAGFNITLLGDGDEGGQPNI